MLILCVRKITGLLEVQPVSTLAQAYVYIFDQWECKHEMWTRLVKTSDRAGCRLVDLNKFDSSYVVRVH